MLPPAPGCVPRPLTSLCKPGWSGGANGGVTAHNVFPDHLVIVWYALMTNQSTQDIGKASGNYQSPEELATDMRAFQSYFRKYFQFYGRRVDIVAFNSQRDPSDDAAMKADAVDLDLKLHAFMVVSAGATPGSLSDELIRRKIVVWGVPQQQDSYYAKRAPYSWNEFGDADLINSSIAEYASKRLAGRPAQWAGTGVQGKRRVFGLAYEGVQSGPAHDLMARMKSAGTPFAATVQFGSDISTAQQDATNVVAQMRSAGVTTVSIVGNPLAPLFIAEAADTQAWFPEWYVNGYEFQDSEEAARYYPQDQWVHAFGVTQLPVRIDPLTSDGAHAAKLGDPHAAYSKHVALEFPTLLHALEGVEQAGPDLTPGGYQQAEFRIPAAQSTPARPSYSFGSQGPGPHTAIDDFAEIWYDPNATKTYDGKKGEYVRTNGGARVRLGQWPSSTPRLFVR